MEQSLDEIAELAEDLGEHSLSKGKVNLVKIAKKEGIMLIFGHYGEYFLGQLVHSSRRFYIHLNLDKLPDKTSARTRFTIAHELGHYFIDSHRINLSKGISLSNGNTLIVKHIEKQANHFASHLLMPKKNFIRSANKMESGLPAILALSNKYNTSIECTAIHYVSLNLIMGIMIKWHSDFSYHYSSYSSTFSKVVGIKGIPPIKFNPEYIKELVITLDNSNNEYFETVTLVSRWVFTVIPSSEKDFVGLEQSIKLGDFGGITLLVFNIS